MDVDPEKSITVYCDCGAKHVFSATHMDDALECPMCGRRVRATGRHAMKPGATERTALEAFAAKQGDEPLLAEAVHLAREHHYAEAREKYLQVLRSHPALRDAFYGLGYCCSRTGDVADAVALLRLAVECGHASAGSLIRKIEHQLDAGVE